MNRLGIPLLLLLSACQAPTSSVSPIQSAQAATPDTSPHDYKIVMTALQTPAPSSPGGAILTFGMGILTEAASDMPTRTCVVDGCHHISIALGQTVTVENTGGNGVMADFELACSTKLSEMKASVTLYKDGVVIDQKTITCYSAPVWQSMETI